METMLLDLVKYVGVPALIIIILVMCVYKYGGQAMEIYKIKKKKETPLDIILQVTKEDKEKLYKLIEDSKNREDNLSVKLDETNNINRELAAALNQSTATNKELCDKMNFEIMGIKEDVGALKNSFDKIHENIIEIKVRNQK